jgi:hypothetical protein
MTIEDIIEELEQKKNNLRFDYLVRVCQYFFGNERKSGSHYSFKVPWPNDPRITLQRGKNNKAQAKPRQVQQVIDNLFRLQEMRKRQAKEQDTKKGDAQYAGEFD